MVREKRHRLALLAGQMMTAGTGAHFLTVSGICDEMVAEWTEDWPVDSPGLKDCVLTGEDWSSSTRIVML
jgi:hypothetical protein